MSQYSQQYLSRISSRRKAFALIVLGLIAGISGYLKYTAVVSDHKTETKASRHGHSEEDTPVAVSIVTSRKADFPVYLKGLGTVTALRSVTVRSRVDGELIRVMFTEGQMVKEGDLLAEIDPRPFQIQLQQAQGQLMRDQALVKNAEIDRDRYQTLLEQDSIAAQQTLTQEALVKQYRGTVEMDRAQLNNARLQLDYARLKAPISGQVGLRQIDQGNMVHANDANGLVVITQLRPITVVFTLPEDNVQAIIKSLQANENVNVSAYDRAGKTKLAEGRLLAIDNQIDASTGTLKLKAQFDNANGTLFPNQFVNIKMQVETLSAVTVVSSAAIQHDTAGAFVYVVNQDKKIQVRRVTLGPTENDTVAVLAHLDSNEAIVIEGFDKLEEGVSVEIAQKDGIPVAASPDRLNTSESKLRKKDRSY